MRRFRLLSCVPFVFCLAWQLPARGERNDLLQVHGFVLGAVAGRIAGEGPPGSGDFILGEERLHLEITRASEAGNALIMFKGDLFHDAVANEIHANLREAYAGYTQGPLDLRLGRQILTWGTGDLFFVNDVFPKDWGSFFSGRPMDYFKLGMDALRMQYSSQAMNADLVAAPVFTPDALPSTGRFFLYDPFPLARDRREITPDASFSNTELALRLYRQVAGVDVSVHVYRGFWRFPGLRPDDRIPPATVTQFYPRLLVYGFSVQRNLLGGVASLEAGYYDSRDDRSGLDPTIPNSQWRLLAAYQRELAEDFVAGFQAYGERMDRYGAYGGTLPLGAPRQDRLRGVLSVRLTRLLDYQTWRLSVFSAYSPTDRDYFVRPEASYKVSDELSVSIGANFFGGRNDTTFFGQFRKDDNVFLNGRFDF